MEQRTREPLLAAAVRELSEQVAALRDEHAMALATVDGQQSMLTQQGRELSAARRAGLEACKIGDTFIADDWTDARDRIDALRSVLEGK